MNALDDDFIRHKVNLETAKIHWKELQRFFAGGLAFAVADELDLIEVVYQFSQDNTEKVQQWILDNQLFRVTDKQAVEWLESDAEVWAVVVKPWVLVQNK